MMRRILTLIVCLGVLSAAPFVSAQKPEKAEKTEKAEKAEKVKYAVSPDGDVYITQNGKKYHKADCPFVHERKTAKVSKKDAAAKNLAPCPKCFKEDLPDTKEKK